MKSEKLQLIEAADRLRGNLVRGEQAEIADRLGLSSQTVRNILHGAPSPRAREILQLALELIAKREPTLGETLRKELPILTTQAA